MVTTIVTLLGGDIIVKKHNRVLKLILTEDIVVPTTVTLLGGDLIVKKRVTRTTRCPFPEGILALLSGSDVNGVKSSCRNVPGAMKNQEDAHLR